MRTKVIYQRRHVLAESRDGYLNYKYDPGWYLGFIFLSSAYLSINLRDTGALTDGFVVEALGGGKHHDCRDEAAPWLKNWISQCKGHLRVRNLTREESQQMQTFIADPQGDLRQEFSKRRFKQDFNLS